MSVSPAKTDTVAKVQTYAWPSWEYRTIAETVHQSKVAVLAGSGKPLFWREV